MENKHEKTAVKPSSIEEVIIKFKELKQSLIDGHDYKIWSLLLDEGLSLVEVLHDENIGTNKKKHEEAQRLTEDILEMILALSALDFSKSLEVGFEDSGFNAVAVGLNMLGEELKRSVVSIEYVNNIIESMNDILIVINLDGTLKSINGFCAKILGYSKDNLNNVSVQQIIDANDYEKVSLIFSSQKTEEVRSLAITFISSEGIKIPMQVNLSMIQNNAGVNSGILLVGRDMRETMSLIAKAERAANAERRRAQELSLAHLELEKAHEKLTSFNQSLQNEIFQRNKAEEELKLAHDRLEQQVAERTQELTIANANLNGEIEERKRAEQEVRAREEKFRNIFHSTSVAILEMDLSQLLTKLSLLSDSEKKNFKEELANDELLRQELESSLIIIDVNDVTLSMFKAKDKAEFQERIGEIFFEKSFQWAESGLQAISLDQKYFETSCSLLNLNKEELEVLVQVKLYNNALQQGMGLITIIDVTETKLLKEQLRQSQKMEAVGQMAGGIAHDFNNLLTVILSYGQMVLEEIGPEHELSQKIGPMVECSERAASLTRQLLAFSRRQVIEPKVLDLTKLIHNMEKMLKRILGEEISLQGEKAQKSCSIKADAGQIEQIIVNLAVNARDAMPHGGKLRIDVAPIKVGSNKSEIEPGSYVMLKVSDTGSGMPPEVKAKIFEPFFTTKEVGKGTGLGLSTVYGIVKQSNGYLDVESELGKGTTFKIYFPQIADKEDDLTVTSEKIQNLRGKSRIFVVEDEDSVRMVACAVLRKAGYQVFETDDPEKAVEMLDDQNTNIDLLISDVIMPHMRGPQMAEKICQHRPDLKVLFMSGYTDNAINKNGELDKGKEFLQKPFTPVSLLSKVKALLGNIKTEAGVDLGS